MESIERRAAQTLEQELDARGLLLSAGELAAAEGEAADLGARLFGDVVRRCYPGQAVSVELGSGADAGRIGAALAFGAVTARLLGDRGADLVCAIFNLGIGLVDALCDRSPGTGAALLDLVAARDLPGAAEARRERGWLRSTAPPSLANDPTAAFTVEIVETFFDTLHETCPDDALRREVGAQLLAALAAERETVARSAPRERLIECSRLTSVLPFEIIETLAGGDGPAGTLLGEAMWRIDDLVDLGEDARTGALNALLLAGAAGPEIARAAAEAAEKLAAGLRDSPRPAAFLQFVQRYAGIAPRPASDP
jgi:hypothetical protein